MGNSTNKSLRKASVNKEDEFYTQLTDIEKELKYYEKHFEDKIIYCNCDDPEESNFFKYFQMNFYRLKLKKLICTHYENNKKSYKLEILRQEDKAGQIGFIPKEVKTGLKENGDFRSEECIQLLNESDIVVTNPPFSLFREYINQLMQFKKNFLIIGNQNAITYTEIFHLFKDNKIWLGYKNGEMAFKVPDYYPPKQTRFWIDEDGQKWRSLGNICWFTNLDISKRHEDMILYRKYNKIDFPKFDYYDAINVDKVVDIPCDYSGKIGVPITFMSQYNPDQFEIIDGLNRYSILHGATNETKGKYLSMVNGKTKYIRIVIKNKKI